MAEFGYDGSVLETFPVDQRVPRRLMFFLTVHIIPIIYWKLLLRFRVFFCAFCTLILFVGQQPAGQWWIQTWADQDAPPPIYQR